LLDLLVKELLYYAVDAAALFTLTAVKQAEGNEEILLKARVLVGLAFSVMVNQHPAVGGSGKSKAGDERALKEAVGKHVGSGEGRVKLYGLKEVEAVLGCIKKAYFSHYLLIWNFSTFKKREDVEQTRVFINTAATFRNRKDTPFTDLAHKAEKNEH
jgi:hypothetical protein